MSAEAHASFERIVLEGTLVEQGMGSFADILTAEDAAAVHASTRHWKPLVNGYSGYTPASYVEHYLAFQSFPDPSAIAALRLAGVTHIVVDVAKVPDAVAALQRVDGVRLIAADSRRRIYRID